MAGKPGTSSTAGGGGAAGNTRVQVVVRVRPFLATGGGGGGGGLQETGCIRVLDHRSLDFVNYRSKEESLRYEFDSLHGPDATQEELYGSCVRALVGRVVRGHNASVMAYGPTGSGKTHTMLGSSSEPGAIPRAVRDLFATIEEERDAAFQVSLSFLEIYQEKVVDLLVPSQNTRNSRATGQNSGGHNGGGGGGGVGGNPQDLVIHQDRSGSILVPGLTEVTLGGFRDFERHFLPAAERRTTASTAVNARSSRSHSILLLKVSRGHGERERDGGRDVRERQGEGEINARCSRSHSRLLLKVVRSEQLSPFHRLVGKLYLVDLAGSEDNRRTGNTGIRMKESGAINSSLLALSKVVDALNSGSPRVPYRDSKLTRLLQDSLGGSAHSVLVAHVAPEPSRYFESLGALNFAAKSRSIVNRPFIHNAPPPPPPPTTTAAAKRSRADMEETRRDAGRRGGDSAETHGDAQQPPPQGLLSPLLERQREFETGMQRRMELLECALMAAHSAAPHTPRAQRGAALPLVRALKMEPFQLCDLESESNRGFLTERNSMESHPLQPKKIKFSPQSGRDDFAEGEEPGEEPREVEAEQRRRILCRLNCGAAESLMRLKCIGRKRAERILQWRAANGTFGTIEDLDNLQGITAKWVKSFVEANMFVSL